MVSSAYLADMLGPLSIAGASGYLLGSLPFGYLVARSRGVNIFEVGSRSPGATNVRRMLGRGPGNAVFILDVLKGAVAAGWPLLWFRLAMADLVHQHAVDNRIAASVDAGGAYAMGYVGLAFALAGHSFSCFTRFRGGKGVATAAGGLLVLMPRVALVSAAIWIVVFYVTRYVSLASILAALCLPLLALLFGAGTIALWVTMLVALFVIVRHRANVGRLLRGTERKFERKKTDAAPPKDET
jgi:glycerol-3-phosphate acyltransferase PlsY